MKWSEKFKANVEDVRIDALKEIEHLVRKQPNAYLQVNDNHGSLIVEVVDDQESKVVQSVAIKDVDKSGFESLIAWYGVYEEDDYLTLENIGIEMLLNILEAVERAIE